MRSTERTACLLLHGFGGSPFELRPVAEVLEAAGYLVRVPVLPGHESGYAGYAASRWRDYVRCAEEEYLKLHAEYGAVALAGLSMGGALCLHLAERAGAGALPAPRCVTTLAAPVYLNRLWPPWAFELTQPKLLALPLLQHLIEMYPGKPTPKDASSRLIAPWEGYEGGVPLKALGSFLRGLAEVRARLGALRAPLQVLHARQDRRAPASCARYIHARVASDVKRLILLDIEETVTSAHVLTTHRETRERVREICLAWVRIHDQARRKSLA